MPALSGLCRRDESYTWTIFRRYVPSVTIPGAKFAGVAHTWQHGTAVPGAAVEECVSRGVVDGLRGRWERR